MISFRLCLLPEIRDELRWEVLRVSWLVSGLSQGDVSEMTVYDEDLTASRSTTSIFRPL